MWNDVAEKESFYAGLEKKSGMAPKNTDTWNVLRDYGADTKYKTYLEVGTWNGYGTTMAIAEGLATRTDPYIFYSLESNMEKAQVAQSVHATTPRICVLNEVLAQPPHEVTRATFPQIDDVGGDAHKIYTTDSHNIAKSVLFTQRSNLPEKYDVVILDGGKYTTYHDFWAIIGKCNGIIVVCGGEDDRGRNIAQVLDADPNWKCVAELFDRECICIYEKAGYTPFHHMPVVLEPPVTCKAQIPVVFYHTNWTPQHNYLLQAIKTTTSNNNNVIVVGDNSVREGIAQLLSQSIGVEFVHVDELQDDDAREFSRCFVNYSFQPSEFELACFLRTFYMRRLIQVKDLLRVFYSDSDCAILCDVSELLWQHPTLRVGYSKQLKKQEDDKFHMTNCMHNSVLTLDMCNRYVQLCFDIYKTRAKYHLIADKWQHHQKVMCGGVCDMTLWFLYETEKGVCANAVFDMNEPLFMNGEKCVFDHNVNDAYGYNGRDTYNMHYDGNVNRWCDTKRIVKKDGKLYASVKEDGELVRLLSVHYQGGAKEGLDRNCHGI